MEKLDYCCNSAGPGFSVVLKFFWVTLHCTLSISHSLYHLAREVPGTFGIIENSATLKFKNKWVINSTYILIQVYIKEIFINRVRKNFVPFWIVSDVDIDCSDQTDASHPLAYTQFTIINGEISSKDCIEKPGESIIKK